MIIKTKNNELSIFDQTLSEVKKKLIDFNEIWMQGGRFGSKKQQFIPDENLIKKLSFNEAKTMLDSFNKSVINGELTLDQYFRLYPEYNHVLRSYVTTTDQQSQSIQGLVKASENARAAQIAQNEALKASTLAAKAHSAALKTVSTAFNMIAFAVIAKGIELAVKGFDNWIHRVENANKAMNNAVSEYNSAKSSLESVNTELTEQNKQLDDLLAKDKLTYAQQGQLEELKAITKELLLQQDIEERRADKASREAAERAIDAYEKQYGKYDKSEAYLKKKMSYDIDFITSEDENDVLGNVAAYIRAKKLLAQMQADFDKELANGEDFDHLNTNLQFCIDLANDYSDAIDNSTSDLLEKRLVLEDEYQKAIAKRESGLEPLTTFDQKVIASYESIYNLIRMVYEYTNPNAWNSMEMENIFNTKGIEKTKAELIAMAEAGRLTPEILQQYPNLNKAIEESELLFKNDQTAAKAFCNQIIACANEAKRLTDSSAAENSLSGKLTASSASLDTFQSSIQSAYDAYAALLSGNYSASELLDSIQALTKAAADMGETIDWEAIADEDQSLRALQEEIDRISQTYAESILNGMDLEPDSGLGKLLARIISEAHTAETAVTDMNTQLDRLISSCQTLTDFLASYNETGAVSLEQLRSLLTADQNLIAMLEVENGQLALNEEAYEQLIEAQLIELKEKLDNAAAAEIEALAKKEAEQATRDHAEAARSAAVLLDEETAAFGRNTSAAIADAVAKAEDAGVTQQEMQSVFDKYTNIWNAAINTYKSNFSAFLGISRSASHTASSDAKTTADAAKKAAEETAEEAKRAAEEAARSAEEALDSFLSRQEAALNAGRISFQEYSDTVSSYLQAAFASGSLSAQKYWSAMQSFLAVKKDSYDAAVSAVTARIDREINTLRDRQDSIAAGYQSQIDSLEKQKELLQDANEERKRQLDLQKALYDQERAHQQRTVLQYSEDRGMHYIQDAQALRDAKTQVEDARLQIKTAELEQAVTDLEEARDREKASLDHMILSLEHYRDQWSQISTAYEEAQENQLAAMILGQNWEADILGMRTDVLAAFTDNYIRLQQQIADAAWESANAQIAAQKEAAKGTDGTKGAAKALSKKPSADGAAPKAPSSFDAPAAPSAPKRKLTISSGGGNTQKLVFARPDHTLLSFHTGLKQGPVDSHSFDDDFRLVQQVGLKANEVPAILKEGEAVATQTQIRNLAEGLRHTEGKAPADQAALTEETIITRDGLILTPIQPGDEMYELMQKYNTYLESIDGNLEKMLPPAVYEQGKQMADAVSRAANSSVVNNQNMQPVSIGDIHITCPGITSQEVARQVGDQLNQMFRGLHLDAIQRSTMR